MLLLLDRKSKYRFHEVLTAAAAAPLTACPITLSLSLSIFPNFHHTPVTYDHIKVTIQQTTTTKKECGIFIKRKIYYDVNEYIKSTSTSEWEPNEREQRKTKGKKDGFHLVFCMYLFQKAYCRRHHMQPRLSVLWGRENEREKKLVNATRLNETQSTMVMDGFGVLCECVCERVWICIYIYIMYTSYVRLFFSFRWMLLHRHPTTLCEYLWCWCFAILCVRCIVYIKCKPTAISETKCVCEREQRNTKISKVYHAHVYMWPCVCVLLNTKERKEKQFIPEMM